MRKKGKIYIRGKKGKVSDVVKKYVEKKLKAHDEIKQASLNLTPITVDNNTGSRLYLQQPNGSTLIQGTSYQQRLADKIKVHGFEARMQFQIADISVSVAEAVRIVIFREKSPEGIATATNELFINAGAGTTFRSPLRKSEAHRFEIYYDKIHSLNNDSILSAVPAGGHKFNFVFKKFFKKPMWTTYYPNTALTTIGATEENSYIVLVVSEGANLNYSATTTLLFSDA